jgi:hypothetical protein
MELQDLIQNNPSVNITISGQDLLDYGHEIARTIAEEILTRKDEKLYTAGEVEEMFNICSATRWRWGKTGLLKSRKIGNRIYYPEGNIKELISKKE